MSCALFSPLLSSQLFWSSPCLRASVCLESSVGSASVGVRQSVWGEGGGRFTHQIFSFCFRALSLAAEHGQDLAIGHISKNHHCIKAFFHLSILLGFWPAFLVYWCGKVKFQHVLPNPFVFYTRVHGGDPLCP